MTKTKRQLRAEAVERLRELNCMDVDCYQLLEAAVDDAGEKVGYRVEIRKLIDLLTDESTDCQPLDAQARAEIEDAERSRAVSGDAAAEVDADTGGTEKTPQEPRECGRITFTDTREMLDEDVRRWFADDYYDDYYSEEDMNAVVSKWLDRQAAITQDETIHDYNIAARESGRILRDEIAELKADNDYLRDRNEKLDCEVREWKGEAKTQRNNFEQATQARKHWQRKYETVKAERDELQERVDNLCASEEIGNKLIMAQLETDAEQNRTIVEYAERVDKLEAEKRECIEDCANRVSAAIFERDRYREKLGRALDAAHEVVRIMEVEQ